MVEAILLSLKVTIIAVFVTFFIGTALAYVFHKNNFKFKNIIETLIVLPMSLPPTVVGYILLVLIGRRGLIGKYFYEWFGWNIVFSWKAACLVAVVVTVPLMYQNAKIGFDNVQKEIKEAAKVDGAESFQIFRYIIFPMASKGILAGILLSCIRAMGEFGATLIVAGNIPGQTQTIPLLIYFSIESGEIKKANILIIIIVIFSFILVIIINRLIEKEGKKQGG